MDLPNPTFFVYSINSLVQCDVELNPRCSGIIPFPPQIIAPRPAPRLPSCSIRAIWPHVAFAVVGPLIFLNKNLYFFYSLVNCFYPPNTNIFFKPSKLPFCVAPGIAFYKFYRVGQWHVTV